jgi:hypothetical protein
MYYLYCAVHGEKLSFHANTCYDGKNLPIPGEQIAKIEIAHGP